MARSGLWEHDVSVPKVVNEGGKIKLYEEWAIQRYAVVDYNEKWLAEWVERQKAYLKLQKEWAKAGLPFKEVLRLCYPDGHMPNASGPIPV